jgi:hypothetical protein
VAKDRTNSFNITTIKSISISWIACIVAEVAIMARIIETLVEVIEEVDFVETVVFKADQTTYTLVYIRRDVTYT